MKLRKLLCLTCFVGLLSSKSALTDSGVPETGNDGPLVTSLLLFLVGRHSDWRPTSGEDLAPTSAPGW